MSTSTTSGEGRVGPAPQTRIRRWLRCLGFAGLGLGLLLVAFICGVRLWNAYQFPYGWSHACDKILSLCLQNYAQCHDGWYPWGEATPEASLSLLHRFDAACDAKILHGKTVPVDTVQAILESGGLLGPQTCGWHYVEGLRFDDNREIALFWDKVGLGHNGERLPAGDHEVTLVNGSRLKVSGADWPGFLERQAGLIGELPGWRAERAARKARLEQEEAADSAE